MIRRLTAIALLAGGLSSCLPAPRRPPPLEIALEKGGNNDEEDRRPRMRCGTRGDHRSAPERRRDLEKEINGGTWGCGLNLSEEKYGEVRVAWSRKEGLSVDLTRTFGLTEEDRHCVEEAARVAAPAETGGWGRNADQWAKEFPDGLTIYTSFGTPPPLLPPLPDFAAEWQAAITSPEARERLRSKLPEETVLEDDGCLSLPYRPAFSDRLERWLKTAGTPLDALWDRSDRRDGLFADMGVNGQSNAHAYVLPEKAVIVKRVPYPPRPHRAPGSALEVCMRPWDEKLRQELRARIEQRASCTTGDLADMLLHPRMGVPAGRRFKSVAVGPSRVCAIDESGRLACCGERTVQDIPGAAFTEVAVGTNFDCGVTVGGDLYCWGRQAPAYGSLIKGPFAHVAVAQVDLALLHVCAIRRDTRALVCWNPDEGRMVTVSNEKSRSAVLDPWGVCTLLEAGPVLCLESGWGDKKWRRLQGLFRTLVASQHDVCGVTGAGGGVGCAERYPNQRRPTWDPALPRPPAVPEPASVVLSGPEGCIVDRSGRVTCWPEARNRWHGLYRAVAAGGGRFCVVTADGRVQCDRDLSSGEIRTAQQQ